MLFKCNIYGEKWSVSGKNKSETPSSFAPQIKITVPVGRGKKQWLRRLASMSKTRAEIEAEQKVKRSLKIHSPEF